VKGLRIAFVASSDSTFIQRDREILKGFATVTDVRWNGIHSIPRLAWAVFRCNAAFSWFALDHAYGACRIARLFHRKSLVVVGGIDVAKVPEMGYGAYLDPKVAARSRYALAHSDRVLPVDDSLREEIARNAGVRRPEVLTVPLGFDTDFFRPDGGPRDSVLTVGYVTDVNLRRKGLETFVQAARLLPDLPFVLVGANPSPATDRLRAMAPANVRLLPGLSVPDLLQAYRRARVYVQVSRYEGFPSALGEAMACGCVPVGTRVAGIPALIGDTGLYVSEDDIENTAAAIRDAYARHDGAASRSRIIDNFSLERRRRTLRNVVETVVGG
jgi:glycosyltransferase involved in cell wall biosynthesis